jgi:hypothetical protein
MLYTVSIKSDVVKLDPLTSAQVYMLAALADVAVQCATPLEISCAREEHPAEDPHTRGQALDVSVHGFTAPMIQRVYSALRTRLGPAWTVLFETPDPIDGMQEPQLLPIATLNRAATARHLHLQPVKGTVWPPVSSGVLA